MMTGSQRIDLERSKLAERMVELSAKPEALTDDERTELEAAPDKVADLEVRYRAAVEGEAIAARATADVPAEDKDKDLVEVRSKASFGQAVKNIVAGKPIDGAEAELRSAVTPGCPDDRLPLELLVPAELRGKDFPEGKRTEERAVNPRDLVEAVNQTLIGRLFRGPITSFFGLTSTMVPAGTQEYHLLQTGNVAEMEAAGSAPAIPASTAREASLKATATRAVMEFPQELTLSHPGAEAWLMNDLRQAVTHLMEQQILAGNGTAPNVSGITDDLDPSFGTTDSYLDGR